MLDDIVHILSTPFLHPASFFSQAMFSKIRISSLLGILMQYFPQRPRKSQRKRRNKRLNFRSRKRCYYPYLMRNAMSISLVKVGISIPRILPLERKTVRSKSQTLLGGKKCTLIFPLIGARNFSFVVKVKYFLYQVSLFF